ncbi:MAG: HAD-IA family hydrolase [Xanthomonadales bacterium]|nr:HAD-IA family hydrolase [Xanthomonadales bacterium]
MAGLHWWPTAARATLGRRRLRGLHRPCPQTALKPRCCSISTAPWWTRPPTSTAPPTACARGTASASCPSSASGRRSPAGRARCSSSASRSSTARAREALLEPFLALYRDDLCRDSGLFAGMEGVLEGLAERRVPWGIVTNKPRFLAEPLLAALGLDGRAAVMLCGDCLPVRKPDPAPVLAACAALGVAPESVWFVGDDERDVQAGRAARCRTAIATWGYVPEPEVYRAWGGDRILARPAELLELFAEG